MNLINLMKRYPIKVGIRIFHYVFNYIYFSSKLAGLVDDPNKDSFLSFLLCFFSEGLPFGRVAPLVPFLGTIVFLSHESCSFQCFFNYIGFK